MLPFGSLVTGETSDESDGDTTYVDARRAEGIPLLGVPVSLPARDCSLAALRFSIDGAAAACCCRACASTG